ncbi:MAG: hypothetical protein ACPHEP_04385 [Acidimicrobiales bacterium]
MPEVGGTVSNSFGSRSVVSDIGDGQALAASAANSTIDKVDYYLDILSALGDSELNSALESINGLGGFSPSDIDFDYQIPGYSTLNFMIPNSFALSGENLSVTFPDTGDFNVPLTSLVPPSISAASPDEVAIQSIPEPNSLPNIGAPVEPTNPTLATPIAPTISLPAELNLAVPTAPTLREITVPDYAIPLVPDFDVTASDDELPALPTLDRTFNESEYAYTPLREFDARTQMEVWRAAIEALPAYFAERVSAREDHTARTYWESHGHDLPSEAKIGQISYRRDMTKLMNAGELRRGTIDAFVTHRDLIHAEVEQITKQWLDQDFGIDVLTLSKADFDVTAFYVGAYTDLFRSVAALYNARIAAFRTSVQLYRAELTATLSALDRWKILVEAEIAKTDLNQQLAANYGIQVEAETIAEKLYEAQIMALGAEVDAFRSEAEAFAVQAEVARTQLDIYRGTVAGYIGSLSSYRTQFEAFEARARGVAAENSLQEAQSRIGMANMQAAGANAGAASLEMEIEAEKLKLEARRLGSTFDNQKLQNTLEQINADIQRDQGRLEIGEWGANRSVARVQNDAVSDEARAAARYFEQASNSSFRASEQAFRAILASAQASAIAQESAGRSAASIANGAYSALSVSAGLSGAGRISGSESEDARDSRVIGDFLNYTESREQIVSA